MQLKDQCVIVTGASSGLGATSATLFAEQGAKVAVWDVNEQEGQAVAEQCQGHFYRCDVTDEKSTADALAQVIAKQGSPRVLLQCAGIIHAGKITGSKGPMSLEDFSKVVQINLIGTFNVMRLVATAMIESEVMNDDQERGVIINTASIAAYEGQMGQCAYSASKGGVVGLTLPAARDLASKGVRVMAIAPGVVETPMILQIPEEAKQALIDGALFPKRLGKAQEFAELAQHIIENPFLNGSVIRMDGGVRLTVK